MSDRFTGPASGQAVRALLPWLPWLLGALVVPLALMSMIVGSGDTSLAQVLDYISQWPDLRDSQTGVVLERLRLPRTIVAVIVGIALGLGGLVLQIMSQNPLADPSIFGINGGATLGVIVALQFFSAASHGQLALGAVLGAALACLLILQATKLRGADTVSLVLAGVGIAASMRGMSAFLLLRDQATLDQFRFWALGSLAVTDFSSIAISAAIIGLGLIITIALVKPLALLYLGDSLSGSLGSSPQTVRLWLLAATTALCGASVALVGPVGFLGLVAGHASRRVSGFNIYRQVFLAGSLGAVILLLADISGRIISSPYETPIGVMTALIGAPVMILVASKPIDSL